MADVYPGTEFDAIVQQNRHIIFDCVFGTATPIQVGSSMAFAKYLSHVGITAKNYLLFLKIVETNNQWVVDELVGLIMAQRNYEVNSRAVRASDEMLQQVNQMIR